MRRAARPLPRSAWTRAALEEPPCGWAAELVRGPLGPGPALWLQSSMGSTTQVVGVCPAAASPSTASGLE